MNTYSFTIEYLAFYISSLHDYYFFIFFIFFFLISENWSLQKHAYSNI